jgi:hypothetical protein
MNMMSDHGADGIAERVSAESLEAASPMIWRACTRAKRNCSSESISTRLRPAVKRWALSAASIMWRMRTASSGRILDHGGAHHLVTEVAAEVAGGAQIDLPPSQQLEKLPRDSAKPYQPGCGGWLELNQQVHVAVGAASSLQRRAEQRKPPDVMAPAKSGERVFVGEQTLSRRSLLM